jgi:hypothetical protein
MPLDAKEASIEIVGYIENVMRAPPGGTQLGDILGAYIFKAVLREAGYAIVPLAPDAVMARSFRKGWFRSFEARYRALVDAAWPESQGITR